MAGIGYLRPFCAEAAMAAGRHQRRRPSEPERPRPGGAAAATTAKALTLTTIHMDLPADC
jgi:hypothetical protein